MKDVRINSAESFFVRFSGTGAIAAAAACITFIVYLPALQNGFVNWDDNAYIYKNRNLIKPWPEFISWAFRAFYSFNWHPLTWLSHKIDFELFGLNPFGHHLTSIMLHSMNTALVAVFSLRILSLSGGVSNHDKDKGLMIPATAFMAALMFGIHPVHVESAAWISERKDVLCAFFYILSCLFYLKHAEGFPRDLPSRGFPYFGSLAMFLLALLSKPMAVSLPPVLLVIDWHPLGRLGTWAGRYEAVKEKIPFFIAAAASTVVTILAQREGGAVRSLVQIPLKFRIITALEAPAAYLGKMLFPVNQLPFYLYKNSFSGLTPAYFFASVSICIGVLCIASFRRNPSLCASWLAFLTMLLPVMGLVQVGMQRMADRYAYLPSVGPILLAGVGISRLLSSGRGFSGPAYRKAATAAALLIFAITTVATYRQIGIWKNGGTLWGRETELEPGFADGYAALGEYHIESKSFAAAEGAYTKALSLAPKMADAFAGRGKARLLRGDYNSAVEDLTRALEIGGKDPSWLQDRASAYSGLGRYEEALSDCILASGADPSNASLYLGIGNLYSKMNRFREADEAYSRAIELAPSPSIFLKRAGVRKKLGLAAAAEADFRRAGGGK